MTRELFTYRGAGTLVRKGEAINVFEDPGDATLAVVKKLVEHSFQRKLRDDWFEQLIEPLVLLSETGRAAAIMTRGVDGLPYLDKFTVTSEAQGEGSWALLFGRWSGRVTRLCTGAHVTPTRSLHGISSSRIAATGPGSG